MGEISVYDPGAEQSRTVNQTSRKVVKPEEIRLKINEPFSPSHIG
jgi:hypothetical protein